MLAQMNGFLQGLRDLEERLNLLLICVEARLLRVIGHFISNALVVRVPVRLF